VSCMSPGAANWTLGFATPGTAQLSLQMTTRSATVSLVDILFGSYLGTQPVNLVIGLADQLYTSVPAFKSMADCATSPCGLTEPENVGCVSSALVTLARDSTQRQTVTTIFGNAGINLSLSALVNIFLRGTGSIVQAFGDLVALDIQTGGLGHLATEIISITA